MKVKFKALTADTEIEVDNDRICLICHRDGVKAGVVAKVPGFDLVYCTTCIRAMNALLPVKRR